MTFVIGPEHRLCKLRGGGKIDKKKKREIIGSLEERREE